MCSSKSLLFICLSSPVISTYFIRVFTDRVRSTTGRICFDTCLSICLSTPGGVPRPGPGGGVPLPGVLLPGGTPVEGVTPPQVPPLNLAMGYPYQGVPHLGYPPIGPGWGVPNLGYPPSDLAVGVPLLEGTPPQVIDRVLDTLPCWEVPLPGGVPHLGYRGRYASCVHAGGLSFFKILSSN